MLSPQTSNRHDRLTRRGLDIADVINQRPRSNVAFTCNIVERVVILTRPGGPRHQSAYRRHNSTKTVVLHVLSDTLTPSDINILDVSAAFDCLLRRPSNVTPSTSSELMDTVACHWKEPAGGVQKCPPCSLYCTAVRGVCSKTYTVKYVIRK